MRLAAIVLGPMDHLLISLRLWIGKRVVIAAIPVSDWAVVLLVKVVVINMSLINWAIMVVGSCRFIPRMRALILFLRNFLVLVPMLVAFLFAVLDPMLVAFFFAVLLLYEWVAPLDLGSHLLAFLKLLIGVPPAFLHTVFELSDNCAALIN